MPTFDSPLKLYLHQKGAFESTTRTAKQSYRKLGEGTFRDLRELTSGSISSAQLRSMGHPYARLASGVSARRGPSKNYLKRKGLESSKGIAPLLPINRQSGRLQRSLKIVHRSDKYTAEDSVYFDPLIAGHSILAIRPQGTKYVAPRGLWSEAGQRARARQRAYQDVFFKQQRQAFSKP